MKSLLLVVMMAFSIGVAHAGEKSANEVNPVPVDSCSATQQLVTPAEPKESSAVPACIPQPCHRCYDRINYCKSQCNGDPDCLLDCEYECQYCCY